VFFKRRSGFRTSSILGEKKNIVGSREELQKNGERGEVQRDVARKAAQNSGAA